MFNAYVPFLIISGVAMLIIACIRGGSTGRRVWTGLFGAGYTIYGLYLLLLFKGGHYVVFYYAFILPIILIIMFFRDRARTDSRRRTAAYQGHTPGYGPPPGYGEPPPGYGPRDQR